MKVFQPTYSPVDLPHFLRVVSRSLDVRSHFDLLLWLQGEIQQYLPHDILIAAWGDFVANDVHHDVLSSIQGVRSIHSHTDAINPLLADLFAKWINVGRRPYIYNLKGASNFLNNAQLQGEFGGALLKMHSAVVHGIVDERGSHDCLYVAFCSCEVPSDPQHSAIGMLMPYLDAALRQITHLPHQLPAPLVPDDPLLFALSSQHKLTVRELEILQWVATGKTNSEIGCILDISEFTVKNHLQRLFKKLDVSNRAQAAGMYQALTNNV